MFRAPRYVGMLFALLLVTLPLAAWAAPSEAVQIAAPPKHAASVLTSAPALPEPIRALATTTGSDGTIYAIGGYVWGGPVSWVYTYKPGTTYSWVTSSAFLPQFRYGLAATTGSDGTIYALGGIGPSGASSTVYAYKPGGYSWTTLPSLPQPLAFLDALTGSDGTLYAIGGWCGGTCVSSKVYAFKPGSDVAWRTLSASLPAPLQLAGATVGSDGTLYVMGGTNANTSTGATPVSTVYAFKPGTDSSWRTLTASLPAAVLDLAAATGLDGTLYALGGSGASGQQATIYAFNPSTDMIWSTLSARLPQPVDSFAAATAYDGTIYTLGGFKPDATSTNAVYELAFPPIITAINPNASGGAGGTTVTVTGSGFLASTPTVAFGSTTLPTYEVSSNTGRSLQVPAPSGSDTVDVTVSTLAGTSATSAADQFTYFALNGGRYTALTPVRILDSRIGLGGPKAPFGPSTTRTLQVAGVNGIPTSATAIVLNVTVTDTTAASYLTLWPPSVGQPTASNLNWTAGQTIPNLVEVALSPQGTVDIFNKYGNVDVIADVQGYVGALDAARPRTGASAGLIGLFNPINPVRILDTRPESQVGVYNTPFGGNVTRAVQVTGGLSGVPANASAVVLNVTVTNTSANSYLTIWPVGGNQPVTSNLNWTPGATIPNRVMVPLGTGGQIDVYNLAGNTDVVIDVNGWFTNGAQGTGYAFTGSTPTRIMDTRFNIGGYGSPFGPNTTRSLTVAGVGPVPADAKAVVLNVTVTDTSAQSYLTVYPGDIGSPPVVSDLNWYAGTTIPNLVVVKLGTNGAINIYNLAGNTDVVVDVVGWYS